MKPYSGFSWADEVEKEEEEEARAQLLEQHKPNKKPNPFGSARPREVVLQEKGIDWRKLENQNLREDKLKENITTTEASVNKNGLRPPSHRGSKQNTAQMKTARNVCDRVSPPSVLPNENHNVSVPPLMYPPKNLINQVEFLQRSYQSDRLNIGRSISPHSRHLRELDMEWEEHCRMSFSFEGSMIPSMGMIAGNGRNGAHYELNVEKTSFAGGHKNIMGMKVSAHGEREMMENMEFECRMNYVGEQLISPLVEGRRRPLCNVRTENTSFRGKNSYMNESDWENIEYEYGRRNSTSDRSMGRPNQAPIRRDYQERELRVEDQCGKRGHLNLNMEKASFEGGPRLAIQESDWERMEYEHGRRPFDEWADDPSMEKAGFGGNYRKRRMTSLSEVSNYQQRRRR
ncbi:uncharacterized protein LOC143883333 [Tasmannia lanceolata]|uniref:uncharacterized protein LOC143883333 n=1 Tax=Tasmannia lanceolata TaxID=3420 RepID=UPI004063C56E